MTNNFVRDNFSTVFTDNEIAKEFSSPVFTMRMLDFERAWTNALIDSGDVSKEEGEAALEAITAFSVDKFINNSAVDGLPVPSLIKALKADLPSNAAKAIHSGATSQDVIDTAMVLTLLRVHEILVGRLNSVLEALNALQDRYGENALIARTRMQAALPGSVRDRLGIWGRALENQLNRSGAARSEIARVQVGGPIGSRSNPTNSLQETAEKVATELGLELTEVWHTDRSNMVAYGTWLTLLCGSLGKIGQDIALMAQQGIDEISLSDGGGSSAMAHKKNPVSAEAMVTLARYVAAQQGALAQGMIHEQERSGSAWALEWLTLPSMAELTGTALNHCAKLMSEIQQIGKPD